MESADVKMFLDLVDRHDDIHHEQDHKQTEANGDEDAASHNVEDLVDCDDHQGHHLLEAVRQLPSAQMRDIDSDREEGKGESDKD